MIARNRIAFGMVALGLVAGFVGALKADDKAAKVTGTYTWTVERNGQEMKNTLKLKQEGEKVTGKLITKRNDADNEADVKDGEFKDGALKFTVTREFNGNSFTIKYTGKLAGDVIKLEGETERNGETRKMGPWDAKLVAEKG